MISIVIPHFNRAELLSQTLKSIELQTFSDWEVIVVDDGSTELQLEKIQEFASDRIRIFKRNDGLKGPSRCRNLGVVESRGDYIMFLDSDDLLAPWCLFDRLKNAEEFPGYDMWVFPVMLFEQTPGDLAVCWNRLEGENDLERFLRSDPPWHTSSPLWRKEAFTRVGGFNEAVMYGDDADLHVRALLNGVGYIKYPQALPDVFIRRSATARITNSPDQTILQSRLTRLTEGSIALRGARAKGEMRQIWEGQHFVEGEFLLFNVKKPREWIQKVLIEWCENFHPSFSRILLVKVYFAIAMAVRDRIYLMLRLSRRLVISMLPRDFFPRGGGIQSHKVEPAVYEELRRLLRDHSL